jgi:hypothetical protein
VITGT